MTRGKLSDHMTSCKKLNDLKSPKEVKDYDDIEIFCPYCKKKYVNLSYKRLTKHVSNCPDKPEDEEGNLDEFNDLYPYICETCDM